MQQFLHAQDIAKVVGHGAEIVDAIGERDHLLVELRFAGLLDAGVQIADVGDHAHYALAVNLEQQPKHPMG